MPLPPLPRLIGSRVSLPSTARIPQPSKQACLAASSDRERGILGSKSKQRDGILSVQALSTRCRGSGGLFRLERDPLMKVLLRIVAAIFVAIALFLVYAVISAIGSAGGANVAVCVGYVVAAAVLGFFATKLWRRYSGRGSAASAASGS